MTMYYAAGPDHELSCVASGLALKQNLVDPLRMRAASYSWIKIILSGKIKSAVIIESLYEYDTKLTTIRRFSFHSYVCHIRHMWRNMGNMVTRQQAILTFGMMKSSINNS